MKKRSLRDVSLWDTATRFTRTLTAHAADSSTAREAVPDGTYRRKGFARKQNGSTLSKVHHNHEGTPQCGGMSQWMLE